MKKYIKILIPSVPLVIAPLVSMVGCNKNQEKVLASISYTYTKTDPKPYVYQSTQWEQPVTSYEDATNVYYQEITPFMICDEIINSFYQNIISGGDFDSYTAQADCLMINKKTQRLSVKIHVRFAYQTDNANISNVIYFHNLPFDLTYNNVETESCPKGWYVKLKGQSIDSDKELCQELKNDSTWYCDFSIENPIHGQEKFLVNNKTTNPEHIRMFLIESAFISKFMEKVADPKQ